MWLRLETFRLIATAQHRHLPGDQNDTALVDRWILDYILDYAVTVHGQAALGYYIDDQEIARRAALPKAYELISYAWPGLAHLCPPAADWEELRRMCSGEPTTVENRSQGVRV